MPLNNDNNDKSCKCTTPEYELILNEQGPQGRQGEKGEPGFTPIISVKDNTPSSYTLNILTQDGQITTPNLKANLPPGGATGQVLTKNSGEQDDCSWQNLPNATEEVEGIARLATETDFTTTEDSGVSETSIVTPALFNTELTKQVQNFIVAGDNITTSVDDDGKVTINAEAEAYSLPQANSTNLGGIKANPKTDEDTQPVNIDTTTGLLYTKAGGTGLVPATDTTLGGIIVGDGLKVDSEGLTSLDLSVDAPLQLQGSIPSNPYILTPEPGSNISFDDLDVIAFNPANGHDLLKEVNDINSINPVAGTDYTLSIKNRTNGVLDWKNNIIEIPLGLNVTGELICSVGLNRQYETGNPRNRNLGLIWANKDNEGNITPLYYVSTAVPNGGSRSGSNRSCIYAFLDNGTESDTSTTNYQVHCLHNYTSSYAAVNGAALMWVNQCWYDEGSNTYNFWISGNCPCWGSSTFPDIDIRNPETWNKWQFSDSQEINWFQILQGVTPNNEDKFVNCAFYVTVNNDGNSWVNGKYPLLAKFTGNIARERSVNFVEYINQINQHYIEVTPASGKPILSLNIDGTTITTNDEGQLQANIPSNVTTQGNTFNGASQLVQLDTSGKLPAIDGSQLTNISSSAPVNMVTTDTNQVITGTKTIQNLKINGAERETTVLSAGSVGYPTERFIQLGDIDAKYNYARIASEGDAQIVNKSGTYWGKILDTRNFNTLITAGDNITITKNGDLQESTYIISATGGGSEPPTNMVTTDTSQVITGSKSFISAIKSNIGLQLYKGSSYLDAFISTPGTNNQTLQIGKSSGNARWEGLTVCALARQEDRPTQGVILIKAGDDTFTVIDTGNFATLAPTGKLKYWTGTEAAYTEVAAKDADTLYRLTDTNKVYLGTIQLGGS